MTIFERIFEGEIMSFRPTEECRELVTLGLEVVEQTFGEDPDRCSPAEFRNALNNARKQLTEPRYRTLAARCLQSVGFQQPDLLLDQVRLRAVSPGLERVAAAAPVYYCHRDTWYGNPKCQVNAWLPLHAVNGHNSFQFFPEHFSKPVGNDSQLFRAADFQRQGGFGRVSDQPSESIYPRALQQPLGPAVPVQLEAAQLLLFSAAHLHQTLVNTTERTRFSLDFRFYRQAHLEAGLGAPDPDNHSEGLLTEGYLSLPELGL